MSDPTQLLEALVWRHVLRERFRRWRRRLNIWLGLRRITPADGARRPFMSTTVDEPPRDTGGFYRPSHRMQDPSVDPREPNGGESSSTGNDHGWSGCTMSAGADALALHTRGAIVPWGGDLRHKQGDLSGGTDLYDLRDAWKAYGETLTIRSGAGWSAVVQAHDEGRPIVIQGSGNVPGTESFDGGHACAISPEPHSSSWLFGDPLASGWQWVSPGSIRTWAEHWQSSIAFATGAPMSSPEPAPEPKPPAPAPCPPAEIHTPAMLEQLVADAIVADDDAEVSTWLDWLRSPPADPADRWDVGGWADPVELLEAELEGDAPDPCLDPAPPAGWARGLPFPVVDALRAFGSPGAWDGSSWRESTWVDATTAGRRSPASVVLTWP